MLAVIDKSYILIQLLEGINVSCALYNDSMYGQSFNRVIFNSNMSLPFLNVQDNILLNTDEFDSFGDFAKYNVPIITYGLNSKASVTASSIQTNKLQVCLQRSIKLSFQNGKSNHEMGFEKTIDERKVTEHFEKTIDEQEFTLHFEKANEIANELLACALVCLLEEYPITLLERVLF